MTAIATRLAFTDRLSPMLVKELRQGMKSRAFGFAFLLMQGLMVFSVMLGLAATAGSRRGGDFGFAQGIFWTCVGAPLLLIMPVRACNALQQEIKGNTLELMFLTRLSAWRIVAGKWSALFSQTLLLTSGILPYLILRYFLGGVNVAGDLTMLLLLLLTSAVLTAAGLCLSAYRNPMLRLAAVLGAVLVPYMGIYAFMMLARSTGAMGGGLPAVSTMLSVTVGAILACLLFLSWGADRICPPAHSHAAAKRLLLLAIVALIAAASHWAGSGIILSSLFVLVPVCLDALAEPLRPIPSLYYGFARRNVLLRLLGRLFYPGWASGALFTVAALLLLALLGLPGILHRQNDLVLLSSVPAALFGPLALILAFRPHTRRLTAAYFVLQLLLLVIGFIIMSVKAFYNDLPLLAFSWLPTTSAVLCLVDGGDESLWTLVMLFGGGISLVLLLVPLRRALAEIGRWERLSLEDAAALPPPREVADDAPAR